jgi:hypothetical protein
VLRNDKTILIGTRYECEESGAPDALLGVEGGEHYGLVVDAGGVAIDGGRGLGTEVAVAGIEIEGADVVSAAGAGELHAALDASDGVVSLHNSSVVVSRENGVHVSRAAKVMNGAALGTLNSAGSRDCDCGSIAAPCNAPRFARLDGRRRRFLHVLPIFLPIRAIPSPLYIPTHPPRTPRKYNLSQI